MKLQNIGLNGQKLIQYVFIFSLMLFAFGISWSVFLVSNSIIFLSLLILSDTQDLKGPLKWNVHWKKDLDQMLRQPFLLSMILYFVSVFVSGLWSENLKEWAWFTRMQLPFLLLPLVFLKYSSFLKSYWTLLISLFLITMLLGSLWISFDYWSNYEIYNLELIKGNPFITHISHVRFSMLVAMASLLTLHLILHAHLIPKSIPLWTVIMSFFFLFIFNHMVSAKTGLIGMYIALIVYFIIHYSRQGKKKELIISLLLLIAAVLLCFYFLPSLKQKIYYTLFQIAEFKRGKWLYYSDTERLMSWKMGWEMICHEPIMGTGLGDLKQQTENTYQECLNTSLFKLPHNQFLFSWAFTGIGGLLSLLSLIYFSLVQKSWRKYPLLTGIQCILLSSFLVEYTLGTQIGCGIYVYSALLSWAFVRNNDPHTSST